MRCCVPFCKNAPDYVFPSKGKISFHVFPSEVNLRADWLRALGKQDSCLSDSAVVCSQHFLDDDIYETEGGLRQIVTGAVPSTVLVCMICLNTNGKLFLMRKYRLDEAYEKLTGHSLCDGGKLKQTVCVQCAQRLVKFSRLRAQSLRARDLMMDLAEQHELITRRHMSMIDRTKHQLRSGMVLTTLAPDHCDLHILDNLSEDKETMSEETAPSVVVKTEQLTDPFSVDEDVEMMNDEFAAYEDDVYNDSTLEANLVDDALERKPAVADTQELLKCSSGVFRCALCCEDFVSEHEYMQHVSLHHKICDAENEPAEPPVREPQVCEPPVREPPVCEPPVREPPVREPPVREPPVCEPPVREPPVCEPPVREPPVCEPPVREPPVREPPVREPPVCEPPVREPPVCEPPVREPQVCEPPVREPPVREPPVREPPVREPPVREPPVREPPVREPLTASNSSLLTENKPAIATRHGDCRSAVSTHTSVAPLSASLAMNYDSKVHATEEDDTGLKSEQAIEITKSESDDQSSDSSNKTTVNINRFTNCTVKLYDVFANFKKVMPRTDESSTKTRNVILVRSCDTQNIASQEYRYETTGLKPFSCKLCNYKCAQNGNLVRHMRTHTGLKPFSCKLCNYKSAQKSDLVTHMRTHTGIKPFACKLCDYKCARNGTLVKHMRTHTGLKPFSCKLCNYKSAQKSDLVTHMRTHTGIKPFACKLCDYKCARNGTLVKHMRTHTGLKPFSCKLCNYKCAQNGNLVRHMRTHTGLKPFSCKLCNYKSAQKSDLVTHMRTHTGIKPFACKLCDYKCARNGTLVKHMRTHTGLKPFSCKLCDYKCAENGSLVKHMRTHTGLKPFSCKLCDYKCAENGSLVKHMRTHKLKVL